MLHFFCLFHFGLTTTNLQSNIIETLSLNVFYIEKYVFTPSKIILRLFFDWSLHLAFGHLGKPIRLAQAPLKIFPSGPLLAADFCLRNMAVLWRYFYYRLLHTHPKCSFPYVSVWFSFLQQVVCLSPHLFPLFFFPPHRSYFFSRSIFPLYALSLFLYKVKIFYYIKKCFLWGVVGHGHVGG